MSVGRDGSAARRSRAVWLTVLSVVLAGAFALLAVLAARSAPPAVDSHVHSWFVAHRSRWLTDAAIGVTDTGTGPIAYCLAALAGALLVRARAGGRWWRAAIGAVGAVAVLAVVQLGRTGVADAVGRVRPPRADWASPAGGWSFPSGHTTSSATVAAVVVMAALARRPGRGRAVAVAVAVVWAIAVGLTRIYLGVHWPTDVLGGWLLVGTLAAAIAAVTAHQARA